MGLAENIRNARIRAKLNQEDLANMIGVKKATISLYENGAREPDALKIIAIARALGVTGDYLLDFPAQPALSPEAMELARKYDQITDPYDKRMIDSVVDISFERCASREELPPIPTTEWLNSRIVGPDPRKARNEDLTDRTRIG